MTDLELIELFFLRNEDAISETSRKYGAYCFSIAENILGDRRDSEECVNTTWLKTWDAIPPARPAVLKLFLAKITRSLAFNVYESRRAAKRGGGETDLVLDELAQIAGNGDAASEAELEELKSSVASFVKTLPERERNVLIRRCFYTETIEDIAKRYGISGSGVMSALSRARKKLRAHLVKEGFINERKRSL
ncbi:MAG: sigma-70 family RNA polymerase sigma factor [Clostridiales bacterium]|nr:sigma-70 family RNA polymerase sigma factor [Clostridiales bacterium]